MLHKVKKSIAIVLAVLLVIISFTDASVVNAEELQSLTKEDILNMNKSALLNAIHNNGLILPQDYATHINMAEDLCTVLR